MDRPFDITARLDLASVRYLHTMRFLKEVLAFCSHFPQLIDAFQRMKAMAQGNLVRLTSCKMEIIFVGKGWEYAGIGIISISISRSVGAFIDFVL